MKETIAEMLKIESDAKAIIAKAQADASEILKQARLDAAKIIADAQAHAHAEAQKKYESGLEATRKELAAQLAQIDKENEKLRDIPPDKRVAAVKIITNAVTGVQN